MNQANKEAHQPADNPNAAQTGNASNLSPQIDNQQTGEQLISTQGEKYLREVANVEDYPDPQDAQEMDKSFGKEKSQSS